MAVWRCALIDMLFHSKYEGHIIVNGAMCGLPQAINWFFVVFNENGIWGSGKKPLRKCGGATPLVLDKKSLFGAEKSLCANVERSNPRF